MKTLLCSIVVVVTCLALLAASDDKAPKPGYDGKGQLIRPADYREWMFLSGGYGMNYSPGPEMFTNVFVQRRADEEVDGKTVEAMPKGNVCWSCHDAHAAVEHTYVQFYPTLKVVAKKFGTYNEAREQVTEAK